MYAYDLAAGARIALATPPFGTPGGAGKEWMTRSFGEMQNAGALSGRTLVARYWSGAYGVNLWAADVTSGTWSLITSATTVLDHPAVSGRNVVWADKRNGTWDIYGYDLGIAVPRIDVTPGSVAFGDVMLGASSSKTVTIKNSGDATLVVRSVALETPASGVSLGSVPPSTTVAPGASIQVKLTFAPTSTGPVSTVLKVVSDDADLPVVRIPVTGAGVTTPPKNVALAASGGSVVGFSHQFDSRARAKYAIDGNKHFNVYNESWWVQNPAKIESITIAFDKEYSVSSAKVFNDGQYGAKAVTVFASTDNAAWTKVGDWTGLVVTASKVNENVLSFSSVQAKYLRFEFTQLNRTDWFQICEVEAYGQ